MKTFELRTATGRCIARHVQLACSFQTRCVGLLSRNAMPKEEGLLLIPGGSIHTLGMRFAIDVVFLNRQMRILGLAEHVRPWRIRVAPRGTRRVLELAAGQIAAHRLKQGIYLIVEASTPDQPEQGERSSIKLPDGRVVMGARGHSRCSAVAQVKCVAGAMIRTNLVMERMTEVKPNRWSHRKRL